MSLTNSIATGLSRLQVYHQGVVSFWNNEKYGASGIGSAAIPSPFEITASSDPTPATNGTHLALLRLIMMELNQPD